MPDSIWDMAIEQQKQKRNGLTSGGRPTKQKEASLLIVGSKVCPRIAFECGAKLRRNRNTSSVSKK